MKSKLYRYRIQFACFRCRKSFKRIYDDAAELDRAIRFSSLKSGRRPSKVFTPLEHNCPDCGVEATFMGRAFRAPRREDEDRWRAVEILAHAGYTFWSSLGRFPETVTEARKFVQTKRKLSDGEKLARQIRKSTV